MPTPAQTGQPMPTPAQLVSNVTITLLIFFAPSRSETQRSPNSDTWFLLVSLRKSGKGHRGKNINQMGHILLNSQSKPAQDICASVLFKQTYAMFKTRNPVYHRMVAISSRFCAFEAAQQSLTLPMKSSV